MNLTVWHDPKTPIARVASHCSLGLCRLGGQTAGTFMESWRLRPSSGKGQRWMNVPSSYTAFPLNAGQASGDILTSSWLCCVHLVLFWFQRRCLMPGLNLKVHLKHIQACINGLLYLPFLCRSSPFKIASMTELGPSSSKATYPTFLERGKACVDCRSVSLLLQQHHLQRITLQATESRKWNLLPYAVGHPHVFFLLATEMRWRLACLWQMRSCCPWRRLRVLGRTRANTNPNPWTKYSPAWNSHSRTWTSWCGFLGGRASWASPIRSTIR